MKNKVYLAASILLLSGVISGCFSYESIRVENSSEETSASVTSESEITVTDTTVVVTSETTAAYGFESGISLMEAHRVGSDGSDVLLFSEEYDENGNVVKHVDYKDGKADSTTLYAYDDEGKLFKSQTEVNRFFYGKADYSYQYDESGNLLKEEFTAHYDCSDTTQPSYDSEGYTEYEYENGVLVKVFESQTDYETDVYTMTSHEEYEYDEKGQLIKTTVYSSGTNTAEILLCEIVFEYDEEGRQVKKTKTVVGEPGFEETYEYDEKGNLVKTVSENETIISAYDEDGKKIKEAYVSNGESYTVEYRWE